MPTDSTLNTLLALQRAQQAGFNGLAAAFEALLRRELAQAPCAR